jgi:hypothetical protein
MKRLTLVLLAVVLGVCLMPNISAQEGTVDGATPITNCMTITQPGSYLVVRNITLTASNAQTFNTYYPSALLTTWHRE